MEAEAWPPEPIRTDRLVLREPEARDRAALIDLLASPEVGVYIGGARSRQDLEGSLPEEPPRRPGLFVVDLDGSMIGTVQLDRRDPEYEIAGAAGKVELGYLFLPEAWGHGYATESCAAVLDWFARAMPGEPVMLTTQTANERSMRLATRLGFTEVQRLEAYGAEQWLGARAGVEQRTPARS